MELMTRRAPKVVARYGQSPAVRVGFITGPSHDDVRAHVLAVDTSVQGLATDLRLWFSNKWGNGSTDPRWPTVASPEPVRRDFLHDVAFSEDWNAFVHEWATFSEGYKSETWWDQFGTNAEVADTQVRGYAAKLDGYYGQAEARGVKPSSKRPDLGGGGLSPLATIPWGWLAAGVVLIGGAMALGQVRGLAGA